MQLLLKLYYRVKSTLKSTYREDNFSNKSTTISISIVTILNSSSSLKALKTILRDLKSILSDIESNLSL